MNQSPPHFHPILHAVPGMSTLELVFRSIQVATYLLEDGGVLFVAFEARLQQGREFRDAHPLSVIIGVSWPLDDCHEHLAQAVETVLHQGMFLIFC